MIAEKVERVDKRPRHKTDWPSIRMLYATGSTFDELAAKTSIPRGTIAARSSREGWDVDRVRMQTLADESRAKAQIILATMPERGKRWASRVAEQTDKHLSIIENESIDTLKDVDRVIGTLDKVDKVARRSYGLDEEGSGNRTIVNLGFLQDYKPEPLHAEIIESPNELSTAAKESAIRADPSG